MNCIMYDERYITLKSTVEWDFPNSFFPQQGGNIVMSRDSLLPAENITPSINLFSWSNAQIGDSLQLD